MMEKDGEMYEPYVDLPFRGCSKESGIQKTVLETPDTVRLKNGIDNWD